MSNTADNEQPTSDTKETGTDSPALTGDARDRYRTFLVVWFGQVVSLIGSSLTWFGLSVWIFLETGSVTDLSLMLLASTLPRVLLSPVAGARVDRWDRRWVMILSDGASGLGTVVIALAFFTDSMSLGVLVVVGAVSSAFQSFQCPAYQAATTLLVPKERYSQASGMVSMAEALGQLVAPFLGGVLIAVGGVATLIVVDVVTFTFAIVTLLIVRFPKPPRSKIGEEAEGSLWQESLFGFRYLWHRHGLFALLLFFAGVNFSFGFISPIFVAYMLSFTSPGTMGTLLSLGATGMLVGSIIASAWKGTSRRVLGIIASTVVLGVMLMVIGSTTWSVSVVVALWLGMLVVPLASAMSQSIWLAKVEPDVQGKVFSVRMMIGQATQPLALAIAGPLADRVFVPLMTGDSDLGTFLQGWLGSGEGSAYGLFFVTIGLYTVIMAVLSWTYGPLRNLERDIPDADETPGIAETDQDDQQEIDEIRDSVAG
jgi:DHA3 family macrolide efflux protein-like MFS transporter